VRALVDAIRRRPGIAVHGLRCSLLIRHRTARISRRAFYPGVTSKSMTPCFEIWNELSSRQGTGCRGDSRCCADRSPCLEARGPVRLQLGGAALMLSLRVLMPIAPVSEHGPRCRSPPTPSADDLILLA
jgi:hypothetical protein